jgi:hypothetical protein
MPATLKAIDATVFAGWIATARLPFVASAKKGSIPEAKGTLAYA